MHAAGLYRRCGSIQWKVESLTNRSVKHDGSSRGLIPAVLLVGGLSLAGLAGVVSASFRPNAVLNGAYGTDAWVRLLDDPNFVDSLIFTVRAALISTALSVAVSIPLAFALRRRETVARALVAAPIPIPHIVTATLVVLWLGPSGLADRVFATLPIVRDSFGVGLIFVYFLKEVPFLTVLILSSLGEEDQSREEAARTLSPSRLDRWRGVLLPQLRRPLVLGSLVVAAFVVGSTEVPLVVGPLTPDVLTTWSITIIRIRGPIARADAAAGLVVTSALVIILAVVAIWFAFRGRANGRSATLPRGKS